MKLCAAFMFFALIAAAASPEKPRVASDLVTAMAQRLDSRLSRLSPDDPVQPVGLTQGAYFPGIGVVFMGSVNLAPMAGITPFHQTISKQEMARIHQKKSERIPKLKDMMQDVLSNMAWSMDPVPADEQIAIAISLFYFNNEDMTGLPTQIVMRAQKKALIAKQAGAVKVDEF